MVNLYMFKFKRSLVVLLVTLCVTLMNVVSLADIPPTSTGYAAPSHTVKKAALFENAFRRLANDIPKRMYDIDALAESMDYDLEKAIEFVKNEVHYDPYLGVMRGAKGTMISRAGSAWDQALLLSALISAMGGEFKIVEGELSNEDSRRLIRKAFLPRADFEEPISVLNIREAFNNLIPEHELDSIEQDWNEPLSDKALQELTKSVSSDLLSILEKDGIHSPFKNLPDTELVEQVTGDYAWVIYRETPSSEWRHIHPAYGDSSAPKMDIQRYADNVHVNAKTHELAIDLLVEIEDGGKFSEFKLMNTYQRPIANLSEQQITLSLVGDLSNIEGDFSGSYLIPYINGEIAKRGQAVLASGELVDAKDILDGPSIIATLGGKFSNSLNVLGQQGTNKVVATKPVSVIIEMKYTLPNGTEYKQRRRIVDIRESKQGDLSDLAFQSILDVNVGRGNGAKRLQSQLNRTAHFSPYTIAYLNGRITFEEYFRENAPQNKDSYFQWPQMDAFRDSFMPIRSNEIIGFNKTAFVAMNRVSLVKKTKVRRVMDILFNQVQSVEKTENVLTLSPQSVFLNGLRQTIVEQKMSFKDSSFESFKSTKVLSSEEKLNDFVSKVDVSVRERLEADFNESKLLVTYVGNDKELRWWKIDRGNGNSLGMSKFGGSETTEWSATATIGMGKLFNDGVTVIFATKGAIACAVGPTEERACCNAVNTAMAGAGFFGGGLIRAGGTAVKGAIGAKWALGFGKISHYLLAAEMGVSGATEVALNAAAAKIPFDFSVCK